MAPKSLLGLERAELEITRPHGCGRLFNFLVAYKLYYCVEGLDLKNKRVLDVCCGSGIDAEFLARLGSEIVVLDYDAEGIKRTVERSKRFGFKVESVIGDALNLPFEDKSFQVCFVNDGLHHLKDPIQGVAELFRVSQDCVIISEPTRSFLTRIAVWLGLSVDYEEEDDNLVYRFTKNELAEEAARHGFITFKAKRFILWHPHLPPRWFCIFENVLLFYLFKFALKMINLSIGRFLGNKICFVAFRESKD